MIAVLLLVSDFLYFSAIADRDELLNKSSMISLISPLRRTSVVIAFIAGILMYKEKNWRSKAVCIVTMLTGVYVLSFSKS